MENEDIDDIFKDFEHKVEGKKETAREPEKQLSEEEILRRKYQRAEQILKQKYKKEREALEDKKEKEILPEKAPVKSIVNVERIAYIAIIIVLIAYSVIDLSFYHGGIGIKTEKDQPITAAAVQEEDETEEPKIVEEVLKEEPEQGVEEEKVLSGVITLNINNIYTEVVDEDNDLGEISKIVFTIENGKDKVLTPVVDVYAYDSELDEIWETRSRGQYTYMIGISPGDSHTGSIDLTPKTFKNLDLRKNIRLVLNDTEEGFITAVNEKVLIS